MLLIQNVYVEMLMTHASNEIRMFAHKCLHTHTYNFIVEKHERQTDRYMVVVVEVVDIKSVILTLCG